MAVRWEEFRESLFGVFYVMTEQSNHQARVSKWSMLRRYLLYLLDVGQVLRALIVPELGWSPGIVMFMRNFDFVLSVVSLIPHPTVPSIFAFLVAAGLVLVAISDTALVMHIFQKGKTSHIWPVMILRFLVTTMVTTFFISIFGYLLFPVNCFHTGATLSNFMEGEQAPCRPWASPMVAITVPSLLLAAIFAIFSLTVTLLSFEVNPLSQMPGDNCTGRIETMWNFARILVVFFRYLQQYITPVGALVIIGLHVLILFVYHLKTLPFHNHEFNVLRGGIYAVVLWLITSSFITLANSGSGDSFEIGQWALLAASLLVFVAGGLLADHKKRTILKSVKRLRSEFSKDSTLWVERVETRRTSASRTGQQSRKRGVYAEFFDTDSKSVRTFESASAAHAAIRILLYEKDERDVPFIAFLLQKALEEHPASKELVILDLVYLRFVFCDKHAAAWQERVTKMGSADLPLDMKYTLYAVDRKAFQYDAGLSLGKEGISAINLMEFSGKMSHARKMHLQCVNRFKGLWKAAVKSKSQNSLAMANELISCVSAASDAVIHTQQCYEELLEKFPGSASLRLDYANFCDVILNDFTKAEQHTSRAELLEAGEDVAEEQHERLEVATTHKTGSCASSTVSYRSSQRQFMNTWADAVMASQARAVRRLKLIILLLGFFLMLVSICGYLVLQYYLYLNVMVQRLSFLELAKDLRLNSFQAAYELRSLHLMSNKTYLSPDDQAAIQNSRQTMQAIAKYISDLHTTNYMASPTQSISDFFLNPGLSVSYVYPGLTSLKQVNTSFWQFGNDFVSAVATASKISLDDLRDPIYDYDKMNIYKRAVVFVNANIYVMSSAVRTFLDLIVMEIEYAHDITGFVIYSLLSIESFLIAVISVMVLRYVSSVFPTCQHCAVSSHLVDSLPAIVLRKIHKFYVKSEKSIALIDDEDAAKEDVELAVDSLSGDHSLRNAGPKKASTESIGADSLMSPHRKLSYISVGFKVHHNTTEVVPNCDRPSRTRKPKLRPESATLGGHELNENSLHEIAYLPGFAPTRSVHYCAEHEPNQLEGSARILNGASSLACDVAPLTQENLEQHLKLKLSQGWHGPESSFLSQETRNFSAMAGDDQQSTVAQAADKAPATPASPLPGLSMSSSILSAGIAAARPEEMRGAFLGMNGSFLSVREYANILLPLKTPLDKKMHPTSIVSPRRSISYRSSAFSSAHSVLSNSHVDEDEASHPSWTKSSESKSDDGNVSRQEEYCMRESAQELRRTLDDAAGTSQPMEQERESQMIMNTWGSFARKLLQESRFNARPKSKQDECGAGSIASDQIINKSFKREVLKSQTCEEVLESQPPSLHDRIQGFVKRLAMLASSKHRRQQYEDSLQRNHVSFNDHISSATHENLAWYFRPSVYRFSFFLIMVLCLCVWLVPSRLVPELINSANLVRQLRNISGDAMATMFVTRELVLNDGFSRIPGTTAVAALSFSQKDYLKSLNRFRLGGDDVSTGADNIGSDIMMDYKNGMYQEGCPWRLNSQNCSGPGDLTVAQDGLYKLFMSFYSALDIVATKYGRPSASSASAIPGNLYYKVVLDPAKVKLLDADADVKFLIQQYIGGDVINGSAWIEGLIYQQQDATFAEMQEESNLLLSIYIIMVVVVFYLTIFRTSVAAAMREVEKTRAFVRFIPVHILTREETAQIQQFVVRGTESGDSEQQADAV